MSYLALYEPFIVLLRLNQTADWIAQDFGAIALRRRIRLNTVKIRLQ
jgi:hypothetical protein